MATNALPHATSARSVTRRGARPRTWFDLLLKPFEPLASMKLTLVLLLMAIFLIFAGTLAQAKAGMWEAISKYFTAWFVWVELQVFFPKAWFPEWHEAFTPSMGFPFFGGATIGLAMMVNLLAAHLTRFRVRVRGMRLIGGVVVLAAGVLLTYLVVVLGDFRQGVSDRPLLDWNSTAIFTLIGATGATLALLLSGLWNASAAISSRNHQRWVQAGLSIGGAALPLIGCILLIKFYDDISALRILWQLIQGTVAGAVLLVGCWLLFEKRAGVVLLHGGVALLMVSQLLVSLWAREEQMHITEGDTAHYAQDIRKAELAVVENSDDQEKHTVVREDALLKSLHAVDDKSGLISNEALPFDIKVDRFLRNAELKDPVSASNPATAGIGLEQAATAKTVSAGASSDSQVDMPAAYVTLFEKQTGKEIGTYLASVQVSLANFVDQVRVGNKKYDLALRFVRDYKPYSVKAIDVRKEDYPGSSTARKFESDIVLSDPRFGVERDVKIHMNNPFRYMGETFYQSNYRLDPATRKEETTFQVVTNTGWMLPYVACMVVAVGMLFQFVQTLMKFAVAESVAEKHPLPMAIAQHPRTTSHPAHRPPAKTYSSLNTTESNEPPEFWFNWFLPSPMAMVMIPLVLAVIGMGLFWPKPKLKLEQEENVTEGAQGKATAVFDLYAFGQLPVVAGGRAKPIDSLARETLIAMSNRTTYRSYFNVVDEKKEPLLTATAISEAKEKGSLQGESHTALEWLLNTVTNPRMAEQLHVIRIDNPDVVAALHLPEDRDTMRFSVAELRVSAEEFDKQIELVRSKDKENLSLFDKKLAELDTRLHAQMRIVAAFSPRELPDLPKRNAGDERIMNDAIALLSDVKRLHERIEQLRPPLAVPITNDKVELIFNGDRWLPYSIAVMLADATAKITEVGIFQGEDAAVDEPTRLLHGIFTAYANKDPAAFNSQVAEYSDWLAKNRPILDKVGEHRYNPDPMKWEAAFNNVGPFGWTQGILLYLITFLVAVFGLLGFRRSMGSAAFWMLIVIFAYHTAALIARMYISGRPPVTNLYSSAVFIGWVGVLLGLGLEAIFRIGFGNVVASICGAAGLMIAYMLSFDGDTVGVEVAVLDTQFWLSTHVVSITVGYGATFFAGLLGVVYIFMGLLTPNLDKELGKAFARAIYGVVCFALFFSFVGTVLGGLWADDSWGRFWGWDPKENGALIIVLWNAIILHARWDKLANERGLAILAVGGNIVTSWSWFGTNQLGVGLHSYGFTQGVLVALAVNVLVNMFIIGLGLLPKSLWLSYRERRFREQSINQPLAAEIV